MPRQITEYRVFIASPGGLDEVRKAFRDVLHEYNEIDAKERGAIFSPVGWEETLGGPRRAQSLINEDLMECDAFVLVLWDRWGSPPDKGGEFTSGCEEEFKRASKCLEDPDHIMSDVVVFFRAPDPRQLADPGTQLKKVLKFRKKLEAGKSHMFEVFDEVREFRRSFRARIARWIRRHQEGNGLGGGVTAEEPLQIVAPEADSDSVEDEAIEKAWRLANDGKFVEAETAFAQATVSGDDVNAFNQFGHYLRRIGRLSQAQVMYERVLELSDRSGERWKATAYGNLGNIYQTRGGLDRAEEMHREALEINEQLGRREGMAADYGNLGLIYQTRGDLDRAEEMHHKALEIDEQLGHREGMANQYIGLGNVYAIRGDLDRAEEMYRKSLEIDEQLGRREGMATDYGNLGLIYRTRGDLDRAEEMHRKALEIDEQLGRREGMAIHYGNLGLIYQTRGDLERAEESWMTARALYSEMGVSSQVSKIQGRLDDLKKQEQEQE